jgi:hypothetical protein
MLGKCCFEGSKRLEQIIFANGSRLRTIGPSALSGCKFLTGIAIPASVEIIGEEAFKACTGLENCFLDENASLVRIEMAAFAKCTSLRFFCVPRMVESIGQNCFAKDHVLSRLKFDSSDSLRKVVGPMSLDEALGHFGFNEISSVFGIEIAQGGVDLEFPGWSSLVDPDSHLTIIQAIS